ncbi:MAG TPA: GFA family protein [Candidatus Binatia bacterium]|nr:GFA family protein [Candidatus Binatia bacterium]
MLRGRCLCGAVAFEVTGHVGMVMHCHCSMCRKFHGTPFCTHGVVPKDGLRWVAGRDAIGTYASSPDGGRPFCSRCGSNAPHELTDVALVPLGNLDGDPRARPIAHIFVGSKAPWFEIADDVAQFDEYPPGLDARAVEGPARTPTRPGVITGSCLCDAVAYEIEGGFDVVRNCHCARCRRARSAAHATNGFVAPDRFRFVRGEDRLVSYKLPEAERFMQHFCSTCGSVMPRAISGRPYVVVPMGGIDGDPGIRPNAHIFVGSKAPWYEIADDLPRYEEYPTS